MIGPHSTIMGYRIINMSVGGGAPSFTEFSDLGLNSHSILSQRSAPSVKMDILIPHAGSIEYQHDAVSDLTMKMMNGIYSIGPGRVCEYCCAYMTSGSTSCPRCSAPTTMFPLVSPRSLPLWFEESQVSEDGRIFTDYDIILSASFSMYDQPMLTENGLDLFGDLGAGIQLQRGLFVCQWCGGVSREGESCQHCSGTRLPLTEAVSVERDCVYCGARVRGGIVCPQCSALVSGRAFAEATQDLR